MKWIGTYRPKKLKKITKIDLIILFIIVLVSLLFLFQYNTLEEQIIKAISNYGLVGLGIFVIVLEIVPQIIHPFIGVIIASGLGISIVDCILVSMLATLVGSIIGYEIGNKYGFKFGAHLLSMKSIDKITRLWDEYGIVFVFVSAISPVPYVPIIFGALGIKRHLFWIYGIFPRMIAYLVMGTLLHIGVNLLF